MYSSNPSASNRRRLLLSSAVVVTGAAIASSISTQFIAWRVGYHPGLGAPWAGHLYAPWKWIEWQASSWAPNATATFQIVDSGLLAGMALAIFGAVAASTARRRRPIRHEGVHGTARFQTEQEIRRGGLLPRRSGAPHAGVYIGGWSDPKGTTHYLRHDGPEHCIVVAPTRSGKGVGNVVPTLLSWPASAVSRASVSCWSRCSAWSCGCYA